MLTIALANIDDASDEKQISALISNMLLVWFAGCTTSVTTTTNCVFDMGMDPEILDRLTQEQANIVDRYKGNGDVTFEQLKEMPLFESYMTEMIRLNNPVPGVARRTFCDMEILGKFVKSNTVLWLEYDGAMRDDEIYEIADELIIDRFLLKDKNKKIGHPFNFDRAASVYRCIGGVLAFLVMKVNLSIFYTIQIRV